MSDNVSYFVGAQGYVWDASANAGAGGWVKAVQAGGGGAGDASAANQVTGNASLASIDGKLPTLASGRIPVVLPAGGGGLTDTELRATAVPVSLASVPSHPVTGPLTDTQLRAAAVPVSGMFFQATQPVSLASMPSTPVTGTFWQGTQPVSAASLPLPAGASSETTLAAVSGKLPATLGQKTMAASLPIVIASDQGAVPTTKQPTGGTNVMKTGTLTTVAITADQVVLTYTVTAGKTFYLTYLVMYGRLTVLSATAAILGAISLESPAATKLITLDDVNPTTSELEFNPVVFSEPIPIAAGTVIRVVVTPAAATSMLWRANFGGYEK